MVDNCEPSTLVRVRVPTNRNSYSQGRLVFNEERARVMRKTFVRANTRIGFWFGHLLVQIFSHAFWCDRNLVMAGVLRQILRKGSAAYDIDVTELSVNELILSLRVL